MAGHKRKRKCRGVKMSWVEGESLSETTTDSELEEESDDVTIKDSDESESESEFDYDSAQSFDEGYFKTDKYKPRPTKSRNSMSSAERDSLTLQDNTGKDRNANASDVVRQEGIRTNQANNDEEEVHVISDDDRENTSINNRGSKGV